jgi:hypothetical protein
VTRPEWSLGFTAAKRVMRSAVSGCIHRLRATHTSRGQLDGTLKAWTSKDNHAERNSLACTIVVWSNAP